MDSLIELCGEARSEVASNEPDSPPVPPPANLKPGTRSINLPSTIIPFLSQSRVLASASAIQQTAGGDAPALPSLERVLAELIGTSAPPSFRESSATKVSEFERKRASSTIVAELLQRTKATINSLQNSPSLTPSSSIHRPEKQDRHEQQQEEDGGRTDSAPAKNTSPTRSQKDPSTFSIRACVPPSAILVAGGTKNNSSTNNNNKESGGVGSDGDGDGLLSLRFVTSSCGQGSPSGSPVGPASGSGASLSSMPSFANTDFISASVCVQFLEQFIGAIWKDPRNSPAFSSSTPPSVQSHPLSLPPSRGQSFQTKSVLSGLASIGQTESVLISADAGAGGGMSQIAPSLNSTDFGFRFTNQLQESSCVGAVKQVNQHTLLMPLGEGCQGVVYLAVDSNSNECRAVKEVTRPTPNVSSVRAKVEARRQRRRLMQEISVMKRCRHPNLVTLYEVIDDPDATSVYLVMKFIEHGPLLHLDHNGAASKAFDVKTVARFAAQLCSALEYLHARRIVHCEIKPENVMLGQDDVVYLGDFGISRLFPPDELRREAFSRIGSRRNSLAKIASWSQQGSCRVSRVNSSSNLNVEEMSGFGEPRALADAAAQYESTRVLDRFGGAIAFRSPESHAPCSPSTSSRAASPSFEEPTGGNQTSSNSYNNNNSNSNNNSPDTSPRTQTDFQSITKKSSTSSPERKTVAPKDMDNLKRGDVWALGMTIYAMLYGRLPWPTTIMADFLEDVTSFEPVAFPPTAQIDDRPIERTVLDALSRMLDKNPATRASSAAAHALWKEIDAEFEAEAAAAAAESEFAGMSTGTFPFGDSTSSSPLHHDESTRPSIADTLVFHQSGCLSSGMLPDETSRSSVEDDTQRSNPSGSQTPVG